MQAFTSHTGIAAALLRENIDTDAIIPSREIKSVSKTGLAAGLFAGWRYLDTDARIPNPDFILNLSAQRGTSILLAGANFGCGSSREHAVWALKEYGIRAIVAPSFGAIFFNNCIRNGLLPVVLPDAVVTSLARATQAHPQQRQLTLDLVANRLTHPGGEQHEIELGAEQREMLLYGLDPISLTLKMQALIDAFEAKDRLARPWIYLSLLQKK